jgi:hypothetical protein
MLILKINIKKDIYKSYIKTYYQHLFKQKNNVVNNYLINRHPIIKWAQRKDRVFLEVPLRDISN